MNRVVFSSASDHWSTPESVYEPLHREFSFTFDPCPLLASTDGSKEKWHGRVFCNPPYSKIDDFMRKGIFHLANGDCELLVYLVPARTDTAWFHDYCLKAAEIRFIRGRLKFGSSKYNAPFPSMIVVFKAWALDNEGVLAA
jgi:site-specific DNA-methyltransferase (adenine-specific)